MSGKARGIADRWTEETASRKPERSFRARRGGRNGICVAPVHLLYAPMYSRLRLFWVTKKPEYQGYDTLPCSPVV